MSDKSAVILEELKNYLKIRILESTHIGPGRKEELLDLLLKIVEMEMK